MKAEKRTAIAVSPTWKAAFRWSLSPRTTYWSRPSTKRVKPTTHMGQSVTEIMRGAVPPPPDPAWVIAGPLAAVRRPVARAERGLRPRRVVRGQPDGLKLEEALQALGPELPAHARLLEAAKGRGEVDGRERVEHVGPGPHPAGDAEPAVVVVRPHGAAQAVVGVVGDLHRVVVTVVGDDDEHGTEDLLLGDLHLVVDVGEDGRLDVPALGEV